VPVISDLFWLTEAEVAETSLFFPRSRDRGGVSDRRVLSGIVHVIRNGGLRWRDPPADYGPHKTFYNPYVCWTRSPKRRVSSHLSRFCQALGRAGPAHDRRLNFKLHAICDGAGRPLVMLLAEGQMSNHNGAALLLDVLPPARELIGDRGYESDRFRDALEDRGIQSCIPPRRNRKHPHCHDRALSISPPDREPVFASEGPAVGRHPLRPLRPPLHGHYRDCDHHHLLAQNMSPDLSRRRM